MQTKSNKRKQDDCNTMDYLIMEEGLSTSSSPDEMCIEMDERNEGTLIIKHNGVFSSEFINSLQQGFQQYLKCKVRKLSQKPIVRSGINDLNHDLWLVIYSFAGIENLFTNRMFWLSRGLREVLSIPAFWHSVLPLVWPGYHDNPLNNDTLSLNTIMRYCFSKYNSLKAFQNLNLKIISGSDQNLQVKRPRVDMKSTCFVIHELDIVPYIFYREMNANMNWVVNVFLREKLEFVQLEISANSKKIFGTVNSSFTLIAVYNNERIGIFGSGIVVQLGIKKLFERLKLDEEHLLPTKIDSRFENLRFGYLIYDKYFVWFCNSILKRIPYPIEDIYGISNLNNYPCFGTNEDKNIALQAEFDLRKSFTNFDSAK